MENEEVQGNKRRRWEWIPFLVAMLLSFFCVFTATAMALMSRPDKLDNASMLPVGTANYGHIDSEKEKFYQISDDIFADATQDAAGLSLTPGSGEAHGVQKTPIFIAFVTPMATDTAVPSPVVVTMGAPGTAVPTYLSSPTAVASATFTRRPTRTPLATSTSTRYATASPTPWPTLTSTVTPWPSATATNVPPPTATPKQSNPATSTPRPTATDVPVVPTATNVPPTATNTATATAVPPTATNTATATATDIPPTATNTATATPIPPTATYTATPTATPNSSRVLSVALVNADTESIIPGYETMADGITLDLAALPTENLNIWATLDPQYADHVNISLTGTASRSHTEYYYPYTFPGNTYDPGHPNHPYNDFWGYNFIPGGYTLTFQPYVDATTPGTPFVFNFTVINSSGRLQVSPVLECVRNNGGGNYTAIFGYNNPNAFEVNLPVGPQNRFDPPPENRGQPEYFHSGTTTGSLSIGFTDGNSISWMLDGLVAVGDSSSTVCSP